MNSIEVEIKALITKEEYEKLLEFFNKNSEIITEGDYQETYYFDTKEDVRIQKNNYYSKIIYKKGKIHDEQREEIEIKFNKEDFEKIEKIFNNVGVNVKIKWYRTRNVYKWDDIEVCLDYTKGYGYIIEMELMGNEEDKDEKLLILKEKLKELKIELTPREEFDKKFNNYKENWRELTQ